MKKSMIYNIIFYSFLMFKISLFLHQIDFTIIRKNNSFPEIKIFSFMKFKSFAIFLEYEMEYYLSFICVDLLLYKIYNIR